ncbi:hypothetical protein GIB67_005153, partial [Kingdonia uniflora]
YGVFLQFTDRGHIFVQVHLAETTKPSMGEETHLKEGSGVEVKLSDSQFHTLSGYKAADGRNSCKNFKVQIGNEEFRSDEDTCGIVTVIVIVEDTGTGIPLQIQKHVFTPFMQGDSSTSRNYGGTGIGLSITKCLVELMGGQITFISEPQIGSTFRFTSVLRPCVNCPRNDLERLLPEGLPTGLNEMKAIVVDGKPVRGVVTKYQLQRLGILVDLASAIKGCLRSGTEKQPDMILVEKDSWISIENGSSLKQLLDLKQSSVTSEMPKMILLAASITKAESLKAKYVGFCYTIMKPLRARMVVTYLQEVMAMGSKRRQGKGSSFLHDLLCGKHILVIDDNNVNRIVATAALKKFGAVVECAESCKAALSLLKLPHKFDACFMVIQIPEMDGFEATRLIRDMESEENRQRMKDISTCEAVECHLPVLAMTADVFHATYEECVKHGMDGYVSKPFEDEILYQTLTKFFEP